ncbi:MAG: hypothetical protein J07HR59_00750 [Halorubrum sp. J07HR59]|nr:MAG: hypothetical protein J07HR59_00750 [Halorubrum sp. J07HR59]
MCSLDSNTILVSGDKRHVRTHSTASSHRSPCNQAVSVRKDGSREDILPDLGPDISEIGRDTGEEIAVKNDNTLAFGPPRAHA